MDHTAGSLSEERGLAKRIVFFVYEICIQPRSDTEDGYRIELILNILLTGIFSLSLILLGIAIYDQIALGPTYSGTPIWSLVTWLAMIGGLLTVSRNGCISAASYGLLILLFIPTTYTMALFGAVLPQLVLMDALLIVIASILISTRFAFAATGIAGVTILVIHQLHAAGTIVPISNWRVAELSVVADALPPVITLFVIALVSWLSNREIERSLTRARASEEALTRERDGLEETVEKRTRALKQSQMERMSQLYRFVEFGRMASGYIHDIANPLTAVSLSLERLREKGVSRTTDAHVHVERAVGAAKRMEGYITAIRKQLQQQEALQTFRPAEEIEQLTEVLGYRARKAGVVLTLRLDRSMKLYGNVLKFGQIVANLVTNAIDAYDGFIPAGEEREVVVIVRRDQAYAELTVKDEGKGIAHEHVQRIFEPFFTTKDIRKGTGIGLATVVHIVKKDFAGSIHVESEPGEGSEFIVRIPLEISRTERGVYDDEEGGPLAMHS